MTSALKSRAAVHRAAVGVVLGLALSSTASAGPLVLPGWDLLETVPGTFFNFGFGPIPFNGVPLGSYDFGGAIGVQGTGTADTIVHRFDTADAPSETIDAELVALQLVTVAPVDFGAGLDFHYVTLQSARGGPASVGTLTIDFGPEPAGPPPPQPIHGTFDSFFDVFFDIRMGGLGGPIVFSGLEPIFSFDTPWSHYPPPGALEITGVNRFLNGTTRENDFWPVGVIQECNGPNGCHLVITAVPEPSLVLLFGIGAVATARVIRRRQRKDA
jgi:hypothetical protein